MIEYPKVCKKISGRSQAKYRGLELRRLEIEIQDALDDFDVDYDEAPSPCGYEETSLASFPSKSVIAQQRRRHE